MFKLNVKNIRKLYKSINCKSNIRNGFNFFVLDD